MLIGGAPAGRLTHNGLRAAVAAFVAVAVPLVLSGCQTSTTGSPRSSANTSVTAQADRTPSSANPSPATPGPTRKQVTLTITGQGPHFYPQDVAVDTHDNVYVTAVNEGLLKLAPGASPPTRYPFTDLAFAVSGGVDAAGDAFLAQSGNDNTGHILKLTPTGSQTELPFTGLGGERHLTVTPDGTVYVAAGTRVLKLSPGATSADVLPFTGLKNAAFVAVDPAGNVYVSDRGSSSADATDSRVVMLAAGSTSQSVLPLSAQMQQQGLAVDGSGNVYVASAQGITELVKDTQQTTQLSVTGNPKLGATAVDTHGNIYVIDSDHNTVIELKA